MLFGPNSQGTRCEARTRRGTVPCANALAMRSTAAASSTAVVAQVHVPLKGLLAAPKTTHGRTTKAERAKANYRAEVGRQVKAELKEIEQWAVDHGHLTVPVWSGPVVWVLVDCRAHLKTVQRLQFKSHGKR